MANYWIDGSTFSDLQETIPDGQVTAFLAGAIPAPAVVKRTLLWWDARWWTQQIVAGGNRTPLNWEFEILAVENDTGEAPPPGPAKPMMRGLMTATGPASTFPASSPDTDIFQAWLGSSGAHPMESKSQRAAVNYSGGMILQLRFQTVMGHENPEAFWWDGPWSLYVKYAFEVNDPSF